LSLHSIIAITVNTAVYWAYEPV